MAKKAVSYLSVIDFFGFRLSIPFENPLTLCAAVMHVRFYPLFGKASVAYPGTFSRSQANRQQGDDVLSCSIFWQRFGSV